MYCLALCRFVSEEKLQYTLYNENIFTSVTVTSVGVSGKFPLLQKSRKEWHEKKKPS